MVIIDEQKKNQSFMTWNAAHVPVIGYYNDLIIVAWAQLQ